MCFNWHRQDGYRNRKELSLNEVERVSRKIKYLTHLTLSGGEPTLRPDLEEIVKIFHRNNDLQFVNLPTNGLLPERIERFTRHILNKCPGLLLKICFSLDGIRDKHDAIRKVPGAFEKLLEAYARIDNIRKGHKGLSVSVNTTFSSYNQADIEDIHNFVRRNMDIDIHIMTLVRGNPRQAESIDINPENYLKAHKMLLQSYFDNRNRYYYSFKRVFYILQTMTRELVYQTLKEKRLSAACPAGKKYVVIDDIGDVSVCEITDCVIGSLRESDYDIFRIMRSKRALEALRQIDAKKCFCTWECNLYNIIIHNLQFYPRMLYLYLKFFLKDIKI